MCRFMSCKRAVCSGRTLSSHVDPSNGKAISLWRTVARGTTPQAICHAPPGATSLATHYPCGSWQEYTWNETATAVESLRQIYRDAGYGLGHRVAILFMDTLPLGTSAKVQKIDIFPTGADPRQQPGIVDLRHLKKQTLNRETIR